MNRNELYRAKKLAEANEVDKAYIIAAAFLLENPNDIPAMIVCTYVLRRSRRLAEAYHMAKRVTDLEPTEVSGWINFGQLCNELFRHDEALRAYNRGLALAKDKDSISMLYTNMSAMYIDQGKFVEAEKAAQKSLEAKPDSQPARSNLGFCQLALHQWHEGWKNYRYCLGTEIRRRVHYAEPPEAEWDGTEGKRVILYGEQGIGDEICFASMLPDAIERAAHVVLDIDPRLESLFQRSFPKAKVYGTRRAKAGDRVWDKEDATFDSSLAIAQIGEFFRQKDEDFPAKPYLVADPDRVHMWRSLWAKKNKPVIGVAWTGGIFSTGAKFRTLELEQLMPIFQSMDAHFVCLQYKDASREIAEFRKKHPEVDLAQYAHGTLTSNYDDTAALVRSLDCVVSVPTAVVHLGAAIGVPVIAMKSANSCWKFAGNLAFHPGVTLVEHQGTWDKTIMEASQRLAKRTYQQWAA